MWGSDWPVIELGGGYSHWRRATLELVLGLDDADRDAVLGVNARRFYGLGDD